MSVAKDYAVEPMFQPEHSQNATSTPTSQKLTLRIGRIRNTLLLVAFALSLIALAGNFLRIEFLRNFTPWGTYIKVNPALCLLLATVSIFLLTRHQIRCARFLGIAIFLIAAGTTLEWLLGINFGIDQMLLHETVVRDQTIPGRMPLNAALCFSSLALSIIFHSFGKRTYAQAMAVASYGLALLSIVGHSYGVNDLGMFGSTTLIAFPMAVALAFTSFAAFTAEPDDGFACLLTRDSYGGLIARVVLPLAAIFPVIGMESGLGRSDPRDLLLLALGNVIVLPVVVWLVAIRVDGLDREKQKALEDARTAQKIAEDALAAKSRFLATVSHEVRTPMAGIIGLTEVMTLQDLGADNNMMLKQILDASQRLLQLLNHILDASRLETQKVSLEKRLFPIRSVLGDIRQLVAPEADKKSIELIGGGIDSVPELVYGDELRVRQILLNLMHNAVKFTETGKVSLDAKVVSRTASDLVIRFSVSDTGPGIGDELRERLFKPFEQATSATSRIHGGSGLGLSIVKDLVELMHGRFGVESELGKGSTFWVELPFQQGEPKL